MSEINFNEVESSEKPKNYRGEYFVLLQEFSEYSGYKKEEAHKIVKSKVLYQDFDLKTTTSLTEEQWPEYIKKVKEYIYEKWDIVL